eukprot:4391265-Pyramimonas_sp.AAC.1
MSSAPTRAARASLAGFSASSDGPISAGSPAWAGREMASMILASRPSWRSRYSPRSEATSRPVRFMSGCLRTTAAAPRSP